MPRNNLLLQISNQQDHPSPSSNLSFNLGSNLSSNLSLSHSVNTNLSTPVLRPSRVRMLDL